MGVSCDNYSTVRHDVTAGLSWLASSMLNVNPGLDSAKNKEAGEAPTWLVLNWGPGKEEAFSVLLGTGEKSGTSVMSGGQSFWPISWLQLVLHSSCSTGHAGLACLQSWMVHSSEV